MMLKYKTLQRRQGERLRPYWSRYIAFHEENYIKAGDKLRIDAATATQDEQRNRYGLSSDIVMFLYMAIHNFRRRCQQFYTPNSKAKM